MSTSVRMPPARIVQKWDVNRLSKWLTKYGFAEFSVAVSSRELSGRALLEMGEDKILTIFSDAKLSRRKQLAKCVTECKAQAANAKQLVGDMKHSSRKSKHLPESSGGAQDDDEDDDEDWSWDTDFDDSEPENDTPPCMPDVMPTVTYGSMNGINKTSTSYSGSTPSDGKEECTSVSSIGSEASSYASGSSGSIQPTTIKRAIPKPPDGPAIPKPPEGRPILRPGSRPPVKRPPSQPPPPPVHPERAPTSSSDTSEDYEVPISHHSSIRGYVPSYKPPALSPKPPSTEDESEDNREYAHVESFGEGGDYEVVGDSVWQPPAPVLPVASRGVQQLPLPPRLLGQQGPPLRPPPLPTKPARMKDPSAGVSLSSKFEQMALNRGGLPATLGDNSVSSSSRKNYEDTSTLAATISKRPLPPVPMSPPATTAPSVILEQQNTLEGYHWFHNVEREDVDACLNDLGNGAYLVRVSRRGGDNNPYTLSIYYQDRLFHLNIRRRTDNTYALGTEKPLEKTFASILDLIEYHQHEPIILTSRGRPAGQTTLTVSPTPSRFEPSR
ncbi:B-cell linker protein isoform X1 [Ixodes scapularis]|uniref:B-cell linker protein isoform X1 n=1 Tax=Ixodes scapularis TaxID=6945 RepID=UPI001A9D13A7|nr:B-cell linker protein isoform X1 [Ixodes scapularis]